MVQPSPCVPELLLIRLRVHLHRLLALLPASGQQALNGVQVGGLGGRQLGRLVMGSRAFLGEVTPLLLRWRGSWRLWSAGLQRRLLRRLVLRRLVRLKMVKCLSHSRVDSVLEARRWLRKLRREILRLAGRVLHS